MLSQPADIGKGREEELLRPADCETFEGNSNVRSRRRNQEEMGIGNDGRYDGKGTEDVGVLRLLSWIDCILALSFTCE